MSILTLPEDYLMSQEKGADGLYLMTLISSPHYNLDSFLTAVVRSPADLLTTGSSQ